MAQKWLNPADESGALDCLAGRLDGTEYRAAAATASVMHTLPCAGSPGDFATGQRLERMVERVHALGPRLLAELLAEIATATGQHVLVVDLVEEYAGLDAELARFLGADRFAPMPLELVK